MRIRSTGLVLGLLALPLTTLLGARLAWAEHPVSTASVAAAEEQASERVPETNAHEISVHERLDALSAETEQLRAAVAAQTILLQQSMAHLEERLPAAAPDDQAGSDRTDADLASPPEDRQRALAELNARLQQQQLALDEAQRRAEKAEKLAAAMDEAQAQAATEIERLNTELTNARTRQTQALQQAVELERRLATAEARLTHCAGEASVPAPEQSEPVPAAASNGESAPSAIPSAPGTTPLAADPGSEPESEPTTAPVFYVVRPADTLSRISGRVYGDANAWPRIYEANRDLLRTPDALAPGMSLVIP